MKVLSKSIDANAILHDRLIHKDFADIFTNVRDVPQYIKDNLNFELREYQMRAIRKLMYTQESDVADLSYRYLLFHMATGSGKTLVMASLILYMFKEHGYQNFLFFVNSDAIVKKTYDNLIEISSPKYLFDKNGIVIDGENIVVQSVDDFPPHPEENTIYIKLTTIQGLHTSLEHPEENSITYEDLGELDIVLLGDEAHHYFALTKKSKKKLTKAEQNSKTWEETINKILSLRAKNRMFGFSATLNLDNELLFEKVKDKIVFQYDLSKFMDDQFSKNVVLLRANEEDGTKTLHSILLSQYRKYIAREHGIHLKPVIMFKSNTIAISEQSYQTLLNMIENLTTRQLEEVIRRGNIMYENKNSVWGKMFSYYKKMNLAKLIKDLQWDFTPETIMSVNSKEFLTEENYMQLNTLENKDNPIRAIFQVAKLNEGWDVLNLFDIVRISEGASSTRNTTDSEAQLIGRGARYYPFIYNDKKSYTRRFDKEETDMKLIETLHYHTINENQYIKNLNKSLDEAKIRVQEDGYIKFKTKIKKSFRNSSLFKNGKIYINKRVPTTIEDYSSLEKYNVFTSFEIPLEVAVEQKYGDNKEIVSVANIHEVEWKVDKIFIQKGILRNKFYRFNNLKKYVPAIDSIKDFIEKPNFLGNLTFYVRLPIEINLEDLSSKEKLKMVDRFLSYAENRIRLNYQKEKGLPIFQGYAFSEMIDDYYIHVNNVESNKINERVQKVSMQKEGWYIFEDAIANGLELKFIEFIRGMMKRLKEKYKDVYLIRNERKIKVVEIDGTRGFMPDFLLYLKDEDFTYQVFIEPKGSHLTLEDKWKQDFLMQLTERKDIEIIGEDENLRLIGIKFYSDDEKTNKEFREDFEKKLLN